MSCPSWRNPRVDILTSTIRLEIFQDGRLCCNGRRDATTCPSEHRATRELSYRDPLCESSTAAGVKSNIRTGIGRVPFQFKPKKLNLLSCL